MPLFVEFERDQVDGLRKVPPVVCLCADFALHARNANRALIENPTFLETYAICNR